MATREYDPSTLLTEAGWEVLLEAELRWFAKTLVAELREKPEVIYGLPDNTEVLF